MYNETFVRLQNLFKSFRHANKFLTRCCLCKVIIIDDTVVFIGFENNHEYWFRFTHEFDEDEESDLIENIKFQIKLMMKAYQSEFEKYCSEQKQTGKFLLEYDVNGEYFILNII